ncbi:hypothetical protein PY254_04335 [Rhodanobacter sp. AS-Z3]|uniref:hypothetical protein n=1 Tax=Rhodanobacter sp. AS-Z3 TaxID=3031330 RepID=UPI00247A6E48|nr:hypothetical protein [Rhodanobacter sp. AS-Z3]WEN15907.1 hypothetical protein PY254_04335 [Rhodanobacter sp. AS-Z3]
MSLRSAITVLGMLLATQAVAGTPTPHLHESCRQTTPTIRESWSKAVYDAPPAVATLMINVIDGNLTKARRQLRAMNPEDTKHWRQTAMLTAAWTGQAAVVDGLLDDGAAVDGLGWIPPYKPGFFGKTIDALQHDSRLGGPATAKAMQAAGGLGNRSHSTGPALMAATECGDVATLDVLLRHHAQVARREAPNVADALTEATVNGDVLIVQRLLDHGADPCADDRHMARNHLEHPAMPTQTLAQIGTHAQLPAALIARLTCPAVAATH